MESDLIDDVLAVYSLQDLLEMNEMSEAEALEYLVQFCEDLGEPMHIPTVPVPVDTYGKTSDK